MFASRSNHPVSVLDECRAMLQDSRKRPLNDTAFGDVFFEHTLANRVRRRQSDDRYELVVRDHLQIVTSKELLEICYDEVNKLFDPTGMLWYHSAFLRKIPGLAIKYNLVYHRTFDGDVLESRHKLLPLMPSQSCSKTLILLPVWHLAPFVEKRGLCGRRVGRFGIRCLGSQNPVHRGSCSAPGSVCV
jgi:hypothetical protein